MSHRYSPFEFETTAPSGVVVYQAGDAPVPEAGVELLIEDPTAAEEAGVSAEPVPGADQ